MCVWLTTPVYGEMASGDDLELTVVNKFHRLEWQTLDISPAMHTFFTDAGPSCLLRMVDDFVIITPRGTEHGERTVEVLEEKFGPGVLHSRVGVAVARVAWPG